MDLDELTAFVLTHTSGGPDDLILRKMAAAMPWQCVHGHPGVFVGGGTLDLLPLEERWRRRWRAAQGCQSVFPLMVPPLPVQLPAREAHRHE